MKLYHNEGARIPYATLIDYGKEFIPHCKFPLPVFEFAIDFEKFCCAKVGEIYHFGMAPHRKCDRNSFYDDIGLNIYGSKRCPMLRIVKE
ncbi:MAG TPA: hypothetical protein VK196_22600 [Magnetospirillum sp.]|nr:hypothetical protein [Magnetospirillum sp.]